MKKSYLLVLLLVLTSCCNKLYAQQYGMFQLLQDYCPGICNSTPVSLGEINDNLLITTVWDSTSQFYTYNSKGKLINVADNDLSVYMALLPATPYEWKPMSVTLGNSLYFCNSRDFSDTIRLYRWDGQTTTQVLATVNGEAVNTSYPIVYNGRLFFTVTDIASWTTTTYEYDTATRASRKVFDHGATNGIVYKDKFYYMDYHPTAGEELFATDIKTGNRTMLADLAKGLITSGASSFTVVNDKFYFRAVDSSSTQAVFEYDGTGSPVPVVKFGADTTAQIFTLHHYAGKLYMMCNLYAPGLNEWRYYYTYDLKTRELKRDTTLGEYYPGISFANYHDELAFSSVTQTGPVTSTGSIYLYNPAKNTVRELPIENNFHILYVQKMFVYKNALYAQINTMETGTEMFRYEEEVHAEHPIQLFPNPAYHTTNLHIDIDTAQKLQLCIYDAMGRRVVNNDLGNYKKGIYDIPVATGHLAAGVYICTLRGYKGTMFTGKLVKL